MIFLWILENKMELLVKRFVRYLLHIFNAILLVTRRISNAYSGYVCNFSNSKIRFVACLQIYGIFLTVCGFMIVEDIRVYDHFVESKIFWLPYFIILNGIMMIICSLLGYLGTCQQDYKLLVTVRT